MFNVLKIKRSAATSLLICGMMMGGAGVVALQTFVGTGTQVRADDWAKEKAEEEHYFDRYKDRHPHIVEGAHLLRQAQEELLQGHELHGHRDAAVKLIHDARHELHVGVEEAR